MSNPWYARAYAALAGQKVRSAALRAEYDLIVTGLDGVNTQVGTMVKGQDRYAVDSGAANAYVVTVSATYITSYTDGLTLRVRTANANTGSSTINVNALGVKTIVRSDGSNLQSGDILASNPFTITYNSAAGKFYLNMGALGAAGSNGASNVETYEERANTSATLVTADVAKKIKYTGAGGYTLAIDPYGSLSSGWHCRVLNGTSSYITVTADGTTYRMYPLEEREFYQDTVNARISSRVLAKFRFKTQSAGAGTFVMPPHYPAIGVRGTGGGQGGGGGGGGGSGRGVNTNSGSGGSGGSGGAAGQNGQTAMRLIPVSLLPAAGTSIAYSVGAAGTKGSKGVGGAGAVSGATGNDGADGTDGAAGGNTSFGTSADAYYLLALGGTAGVNKGLKGLKGSNSQAGGAAVTNSASVTAAAILNFGGTIVTANSIGAASTAGTAQTSVAPGTAGGAGGPGSTGWSLYTARSAAAGGVAQSGAVPATGNNGTTPVAETVPGVGGLGGGGGGGSPGVGAGASAATGAGGDGGDGADGGPGEIEIWGA